MIELWIFIEVQNGNDDEDNNHNAIIEKNIKENTTHSKQDKVTAITTGANMTATEAILIQKAENRRVEARERKKKNGFAERQTIDVIGWGEDINGITIILEIGECPLASWNAQMLPTFCQTVIIIVPEKSKVWKDCIQHIIDFHNTVLVRK